VNNLTFVLAVVLSFLGIFVQALFSFDNALTQFSFLVLSVVIYLTITRIDLDFWLKLAKPLTVLGLILLAALLVIGDPIRGAKRWFVLLGFNLQPSVVFLPFFLLFIAMMLTKNPNRQFKNLFKTLAYILVPVFFVFKQPDLGTAVVLFFSLASVTYFAGFPWRYYLSLLLAFLPLSAFSLRFLKTYQIQRLTSFISPQYDPSGINYNSLQSVIAIGSGFIFGKGIDKVSQSKLLFLPEAHTDFAFATFVEAFGLLGGVLILGLMFYFLLNLLRQSDQANNSLVCRYYAFGMFSYFFIQTVFNIGMNLRLLPVVGVPLPFISYGGSSLLSNFILLSLGHKLKEL